MADSDRPNCGSRLATDSVAAIRRRIVRGNVPPGQTLPVVQDTRAPYGAFKTSDGYIVIAFPSLKKLGEIIGEESFLEMDDENDAWERRDEIFARTREKLLDRTSASWQP